MSELSLANRDDLRQAIQRLGGAKEISKQAGLVPYREWRWIEGIYELLQRLNEYIKDYPPSSSSSSSSSSQKSQQQQQQSSSKVRPNKPIFPSATEIRARGYEALYHLIQYYGGRKFVAARFGMAYSRKQTAVSYRKLVQQDMSWGPFDLEFGIDLLSYVREDQMAKQPPLRVPTIPMPSPSKLGKSERGRRLHHQILQYGGYESMARRLGLDYTLPLADPYELGGFIKFEL